MSDGIGSKVEGLFDGLEDVNKPAIVELRRKLKKYTDAEKEILGKVKTMRDKAAGLVVFGLGLADWAKKNKGPDADAFKKRAKEFDKAINALETFTDAIDGVIEGTASGKTRLPGAELQKVLDLMEFKDKAKIANVRKAAQDYYPAESAGQKKLQEWAVQLNILANALNEGLAALDPNDKVEEVNLSFGRIEVMKPAIELKKKIDGLGI
jgi:hypothetical protein